MQKDQLTLVDVLNSVKMGEIIENYPKGFPYLSCLIYGKSTKGEPTHSVWGYDQKKDIGIMITAYRPDPKKWVDFRERR